MLKLLWRAALTLGLAACATLPQGKRTPGDPWERFNRSMWVFDNAFDHAILRPVAQGYAHVTPAPVRRSVHNFMTNLTYSDTVVNDLLQAKFQDFANDMTRLVVNTVLGVGGLFDPATHMNLDRHDTDVGQTLGIWGIQRGPYLVLPFLGPSDVRDAVGLAGDSYLEPFPYIQDPYVGWGLYLGDKLDERVQLLPQDPLIDSSYDPYAFVRNAYLQEREFKVHGSQTETPEELFPGENVPGNTVGPGANGAPAPSGATSPSRAPAPQTPQSSPPP